MCQRGGENGPLIYDNLFIFNELEFAALARILHKIECLI